MGADDRQRGHTTTAIRHRVGIVLDDVMAAVSRAGWSLASARTDSLQVPLEQSGTTNAKAMESGSDPDVDTTIEPDVLGSSIRDAARRAVALSEVVCERTIDVDPTVDEDAFFTDNDGRPTVTTRYDLEKAVPTPRKSDLEEIDRYWVNKPYAFVIVFRSRRENEAKYYLVEPSVTPVETELYEFLTTKLRSTIKYGRSDGGSSGQERASVIEREARRLLDQFGLLADCASGRFQPLSFVPLVWGPSDDETRETGTHDGSVARPESARLREDTATLDSWQVERLLYFLRRDFVGYERIDGITRDPHVEDISCDGYDAPVFVYHAVYENLITNLSYDGTELDDFVITLAQRAGKAISKRQPQVDATLPDGSRAQLTLGREVADHGTNYTIRQFRDRPFTPVDLINWRTFSLPQMAFLWLCIENGKSALFAGGTASGKTTSLNAVSLFIPSNTKIVSIEDTREVELPQRNWIASVTRPSFAADGAGDIDAFDLLEAALRQRPEYLVMGEVRGEEGRTLFQIMSTGHTTYTTFHAGSVEEVVKRFTTDPISVSKTLFTALDFISVQTQTRIGDRSVRRNETITEIDGYDQHGDELAVTDIYRRQPGDDRFEKVARSSLLSEIADDRGWDRHELERELFERRAVLAYLIRNEIRGYAEVAATIQAYMAAPDMVLSLMADGALRDNVSRLVRMERLRLEVPAEMEIRTPRPDPGDATMDRVDEVLDRAETELFDRDRGGDHPRPRVQRESRRDGGIGERESDTGRTGPNDG